MLMVEKMILAIFIVPIASGAETEFKIRICLAVSSAYSAAMFGNHPGRTGPGCICGLLLPLLLSVYSAGIHSVSHKSEEEQQEIQDRQRNGNLRPKVADEEGIEKESNVQIRQPFNLNRNQEHQKKFYIRINKGKGQEQGHVDVVCVKQIDLSGHEIGNKSTYDRKKYS